MYLTACNLIVKKVGLKLRCRMSEIELCCVTVVAIFLQVRSELVKQSSEVERQHRTARQNLAERCIVKACHADSDEEGSRTKNNLPGGLWGSGVTRDVSPSNF